MGGLIPWFDRMFQQEISDFYKEMDLLAQDLQRGCIRSDYYQTEDEVVVMVEIPGLKSRHELNVRVEENTLYVQGVMTHGDVRTQFMMNVFLPAEVDPSRIQTDLDQENQVLTVRLSKVGR